MRLLSGELVDVARRATLKRSRLKSFASALDNIRGDHDPDLISTR